MTSQDLHKELDALGLRLLELCQDLVMAKLKLERWTKEGQLCLAKSRYCMKGSNSVSSLQIPATISANVTVNSEECMRNEYKVRFNYLSLSSGHTSDQAEVEQLTSDLASSCGLRSRRRPIQRHDQASDQQQDDTKTVVKDPEPVRLNVDPLKWFGYLVPNSLRQSQEAFRQALQVSLECANIQNEILGVVARKKFLTRTLAKTEQLSPPE